VLILTGAGRVLPGGDVKAMKRRLRTRRRCANWCSTITPSWSRDEPRAAGDRPVHGPAFGGASRSRWPCDFVAGNGFCAVFGRIGVVPDMA